MARLSVTTRILRWSNFDLPRPGQTIFFGEVNVFANNFWTKTDRENAKHHRIPRSRRRDHHRAVSNHMHRDPEKSIWKFDLRSGQMTWPKFIGQHQVKWPDLMNNQGRSFCISVDVSWIDKYNVTRPRLYIGSVRSYWRKRFRDLRWRHIWWRHMTCTGSSDNSCTWFIAKLFLNRHV